MFLCLLFWITNRFQLLPKINRITNTVKSKLPIINLSLDCFDYGTKYSTRIESLSLAAYTGNLKKVEALLKNGADVNEEGYTGFTPIFDAIFASNVQMITFLSRNGANLNKVCVNWFTPILLAIHKDNVEVLKCLFENGADINFGVNGGLTPITSAI